MPITTGNFPKSIEPGRPRRRSKDEMPRKPRRPSVPKPKGRGKSKKMSEALLDWRAEQPPSAVMKPSTFESIRKRAAKAGATDPEAVAGAAYWRTAEAKFKKRKKS